jgi:ABC-2 type transport system permease protein
MNFNFYGCFTLFFKEVSRFAKVGVQTVFSPMITALLYLLIFSYVLKGRVDVFSGISYAQFLIPGLVMMSVIQNSFANSSSSIIQSKVSGNIIFPLLAPLSPVELFIAYTGAAVVRGAVVGIAVYVVALFFIPLPVHSLMVIILFGLLASMLMGAFGVIAGLWAEKFDQMSAFTNFIIIPMSFLSGVFYSVHSLPPFWQRVSHFNPFFYMIDGFRYGFFGDADISPSFSFIFVSGVMIVLSAFTIYLLRIGYKIRG